jgi:hypothetical protein
MYTKTAKIDGRLVYRRPDPVSKMGKYGSRIWGVQHGSYLGAYYQFIGCNSSAFFGVDSDLGFSNLGSLGDI